MARTQTLVQLTQDLIAKLDEEAAERGMSRSAVIREAIESHIAAREHDAIGEAIAEGYRRIPPGTPDEWGDLELMADIAGREAAQRLDHEEREAGFDPW
jgi:predicted transcriptional regulator